MAKFFLIDGYGFVFRAFHSMPPLTTPQGNPIGAIYGFSNMLAKFLDKHAAGSIAVVLDSPGKNIRHEIYQDYKANRPTPPSELIEQLPIVREAVAAFNVKVIEESGFEADDLIATYAKFAAQAGHEVVIVSSDKDLMQLINENISMYDPMKDKYIKAAEVEAKFGVHPKHVADMLALIGDVSDNVPGIKGIGPKTAADLINEFGSLDGIYNSIESVQNPRRKKMLLEGKDSAYVSKKLVELNHATPVKFSLDELKFKEVDGEQICSFLSNKGFKSLLAKFQTKFNIVSQPVVNLAPKVQEAVFHELKDFKKLSAVVYAHGKMAVHLQDATLQISVNNQHFIISNQSKNLQSDLFAVQNIAPIEDGILAIKNILEDESIIKISIDAKALLKKLNVFGIRMKNYHDLSLMLYAIGAGRSKCDAESIFAIYAPNAIKIDSSYFEEIYAKLLNEMLKSSSVSVYQKLDLPFLGVVNAVEERGVRIDATILKKLSHEFASRAKVFEQRIFAIAGKEFNVGSPKQLGIVLFEDLKIPSPKKSKTGNYSTGSEILEALAEQGFEIATMVLEWRHLTKLISTYTDALPKAISPQTNRVHTTFSLTLTSTGRLSSHDPNLQNIPIRTQEGARIREAFTASPGNVIVSADYSQIELRLLAHFANIPELKNAFRNNADVHSITASQIFGIPLAQVDDELRRKAKMINFGIIYGISAFGLAKRLDISRKTAQEYIAFYFKQYPGIEAYMKRTIEFAKEYGYVETLFGRKCYMQGINDKNFAIRGFAERAAINAPLQGTAADMIKKAMIKIPAEFSQYMTLQIHDELLFEVPRDKADALIASIKYHMENVTTMLDVPITVDASIGDSW